MLRLACLITTGEGTIGCRWQGELIQLLWGALWHCPTQGTKLGLFCDRSPSMKPSDLCHCHGIHGTNKDSAKLKDLNGSALIISLGPGYCMNSVWNEIPPKQVLEVKTKFEYLPSHFSITFLRHFSYLHQSFTQLLSALAVSVCTPS